MFKELRSTVVVTANTFNPSIVSQIWLLNKGIVKSNEFKEGCIYTGEISQTEAQDFNLLVLPPQLQFTPKVPEKKWAELAQTAVGSFVNALPETPYSAIGINYTALISPASRSSIELEKEIFYSTSLPFADEFQDSSCRFGGYFSKDMFDGRLKLDIKPFVANTEAGSEDGLKFNFNFHRDISEDDRVHCIESHLSHMDECLEVVHRITGRIES